VYVINNPILLDEKLLYKKLTFLKTIKMIILFQNITTMAIQMKAPDIFVHKKMVDIRIGDDLSEIFVEKFTNLHGFSLRLSYLEDQYRMMESNGQLEGLDAEYLKTILSKLNANVDVVEKVNQIESSKIEVNNIAGIYDLSFNMAHQKIKSKGDQTNYLYPHEILEVRVLVPKAKLASSLKLFLQPFSIKVWITLIVVFMTLGWGWHRLNRRYSKKKLTRTEIGFQLTRMQITQGFNLASIIVPLRFKRVFVIGFIFWSFVLSQAYQSVMIANLLEPFSNTEINTIKQLNKSSLTIYTSQTYFLLANEVLPNMINLKVNTKKYVSALKHEFEPNTAYVMSNIDAYSIIYSEKNIKNGRPIMHLMEEVLAYAPQSYVINKKLPLKEEIDDIIGRIRASGIDQYWKTLAFGRAEVRYKQKLAQTPQPSLKLEQFGYAFKVLFIGHTLAFIVFIFELIWARLRPFVNTYLRLPIRH
jgi:ribosomal protein S17E